MNLNHINLVVKDVPAAVQLFEKHFNFSCVAMKGGNAVAILKGEDNFILVLMTSKGEDFHFPDAFHIGFMQASTEEVHAIYDGLKADGIDVQNTPGKIRDSFGFYFRFDTILIEVGHYLN